MWLVAVKYRPLSLPDRSLICISRGKSLRNALCLVGHHARYPGDVSLTVPDLEDPATCQLSAHLFTTTMMLRRISSPTVQVARNATVSRLSPKFAKSSLSGTARSSAATGQLHTAGFVKTTVCIGAGKGLGRRHLAQGMSPDNYHHLFCNYIHAQLYLHP